MKKRKFPRLVEESRATTEAARVYIKQPDGYTLVHQFEENSDAYRMWINLPRNVGAALRLIGDKTPVYGWDFARGI
jgi:hypothetical protein